MSIRLRLAAPLLLALLGSGCPAADTVALGGACTNEAECKDPADTCMSIAGESLCTLACSADDPCPEGYQCARMEVRVEGADGAGKAGAAGYCLEDARVGSHVATIAPAGARKKKRRERRKERKRRRKAKRAEAEAESPE